MDGQKSHGKLTRTQSSLLRSSPTVRSSIHSLSSVIEEDVIAVQAESDEEKQKSKKYHRPTSLISPFLALILLAFFAFFSLLFFSLFYAKKEDIPTSENLLLALIFIALTLFVASKNKYLIRRTISTLRQSWEENAKRFGFSRNNAKPVQWFIGDSYSDSKKAAFKRDNKIIKEGVEFYSNGDFYEGEFHKGRCNGSGVYNYFVNGRYEGDWIDGRYDGHGIESWARGSRYRGQYRLGLRHGYGVYRFYTGDTYAGKWCNGQSHGVGVQTCSDGSCYVGEFKCGVKHGLGCYHFR